MTKRQHFLVILAIVAIGACSAVTASAQTAPSASAHWTGAIQALKDFEMVLDLAKNNKGEWIGSLSLPGFGQIDSPLDSISSDGKKIEFRAGGASYEGRVSEDGNGFSGTVRAAIGDAPFELKRDGAANVKVPPPSSTLSKEFEGAWEGIVKTPARNVRFVLKFARGAEARATGTITTVDSDNQEFPITTINQTRRTMKFEIRGAIRATFDGSLNEGGTEINGTWTEAGSSLPFTAQRAKP